MTECNPGSVLVMATSVTSPDIGSHLARSFVRSIDAPDRPRRPASHPHLSSTTAADARSVVDVPTHVAHELDIIGDASLW